MGFRRTTAAAAALILVVEAIGIVLLHIFLSMVVDEQKMSLAGLDSGAMSTSTVIGGALFGVYLLLCAGVLVRTALRDAAPRGLWRILLIAAAVVHGLLGAVSVGLVGWAAFAFMVAVLGLLVWALVNYPVDEDEASAAPGDAEPEPAFP
jgi:hypothetical protein